MCNLKVDVPSFVVWPVAGAGEEGRQGSWEGIPIRTGVNSQLITYQSQRENSLC